MLPFDTMNVSILKRADEFAVAHTVLISFNISLVPGFSEGRIGHLDHEQVEVGCWAADPRPQTLTFMISTGPRDSIFTRPCALDATVGN